VNLRAWWPRHADRLLGLEGRATWSRRSGRIALADAQEAAIRHRARDARGAPVRLRLLPASKDF
jgi:hypothetical protein